MKARALLLVDLQNDFCAGGALAVEGGDSTVDVANTLIPWFKSRGEPVLTSMDWHPARHGSFASQHGVEPFVTGELEGLAQIDSVPFFIGIRANSALGQNIKVIAL